MLCFYFVFPLTLLLQFSLKNLFYFYFYSILFLLEGVQSCHSTLLCSNRYIVSNYQKGGNWGRSSDIDQLLGDTEKKEEWRMGWMGAPDLHLATRSRTYFLSSSTMYKVLLSTGLLPTYLPTYLLLPIAICYCYCYCYFSRWSCWSWRHQCHHITPILFSNFLFYPK
jgi:hypothetical protein